MYRERLEIDPTDTFEMFQLQLFSLFDVEPDQQLLQAPGFVMLTKESEWSSIVPEEVSGVWVGATRTRSN